VGGSARRPSSTRARLRRRSLALVLEGLRADPPTIELPGPTVTDDEFAARWIPRT